jgi:alkylation response protein AidB-like acyl-CoA dehydrogenase
VTAPAVGTEARQLVDERVAQLLERGDFAHPREFWGLQYDLGLAFVQFPLGSGGLGVDAELQRVVDSRLREAGAPMENRRINGIGLGFAAPTIAVHGTDAQRSRYLRPMFTTEELWCQLFSEPGAGSDLAGLATRAVQEGDTWVVNGQKVWTSLAHHAQLAMLVARTDPDVPKHRGLTYFIVDMTAPGVEVRPLRQMTGEAEFNEVYLTDVHLSDEARVGEPGSGWRVAMTTLANERQTWSVPDLPREGGPIGQAVKVWREAGWDDPVRRDELLQLWVRAEVYRLNSIRGAQGAADGTPGPEGSIGKMVSAELYKEITSFTVELLGADGLLYSGYDEAPARRLSADDSPWANPDAQRAFLRSRANSIEAGSTEINKNIVAERVLGLPGDIKVDRDRPWRELKRS